MSEPKCTCDYGDGQPVVIHMFSCPQNPSAHPRCSVSCKHYRVGYTDTKPLGLTGTNTTHYPPSCEHPTRTGGTLYVKSGEERPDCPLRSPR